MKLPYNPNDKKSIIAFAKLLKEKTLRKVCDTSISDHNYSGKGNFGQILEKFYFLYEPNSNSEPDFPNAGLELKSTPLKQLQNKEYRSKERLVLNIINYINVVNQNFENSDFFKKNASILLIFYLHNADFNVLDYVIKLVDEWSFPNTDLEIIKKDWQTIKQKIAEGKAHELSEGDTFYLGACTKGANANSTRKQPFSDIPAKQRAYSFKQGYVNHIIATIANETTGVYGKLIPTAEIAKKLTIEEIVTSKFKPYFGKTIEQIQSITGIKLNLSSKNFYSRITKAILDIDLKSEIEEFEKANIVIKTIRIEANNRIKESVSFPAFEFEEIYNQNWNNCELKELVERKFLFIFLKNDGKNYSLKNVKFWNMPFKDRIEMRRIWLETKKIIQTGKIFKNYQKDKNGKLLHSKKGNLIKLNNFPKIKNSYLTHIRPHGKDASDTYPLPIIEFTLNELEYSKQCFWLNNTYVRDEIYLK